VSAGRTSAENPSGPSRTGLT